MVQLIHQYETTLQSLKADLLRLHDESGKTAILQQTATKAAEQATQVQATVNSKQVEIDAQRQHLEDLAPAQINRQLHQRYEQRADIGKLLLMLRDITEKQEAQRRLEQNLTAQEQLIVRLKETCKKAKSSLEQAKKNNDDANHRLLTMQTSLEEHLLSLRHRMVEEHTQTCPLCGQHIDHIELDEKFRAFLTPQEQEQAATQKALEQASQLHQTSEQEYHQAFGKQQTTRQHLTRQHLTQQQCTLDKVQTQATQMAVKLGWDTAFPTEQQVSDSLEELQQIIMQLERKQKEEEQVQLNARFGGTRFRTLVQSYILRPLQNNANNYLQRITDRYRLTCSEENEQLSILVHDRYHKDQVRSATVLSGGERFMISLALSLALSSFNRPDMKVNILFIDEGFGTLDEHSLDSVMSTLERLQEMARQSNRRVGIISHREELEERIPVQIRVEKRGEGRGCVTIKKL